jgi:hypothetical protein
MMSNSLALSKHMHTTKQPTNHLKQHTDTRTDRQPDKHIQTDDDQLTNTHPPTNNKLPKQTNGQLEQEGKRMQRTTSKQALRWAF